MCPISLFNMKYIEKKRYFSHFISIKKTSWNLEKLINDIWMGIVFILIRKKDRSPLKYWRGVITNF